MFVSYSCDGWKEILSEMWNHNSFFWYLDLEFTQTFKEQGLNFIAEVRLSVMGFMVGCSGGVTFWFRMLATNGALCVFVLSCVCIHFTQPVALRVSQDSLPLLSGLPSAVPCLAHPALLFHICCWQLKSLCRTAGKKTSFSLNSFQPRGWWMLKCMCNNRRESSAPVGKDLPAIRWKGLRGSFDIGLGRGACDARSVLRHMLWSVQLQWGFLLRNSSWFLLWYVVQTGKKILYKLNTCMWSLQVGRAFCPGNYL